MSKRTTSIQSLYRVYTESIHSLYKVYRVYTEFTESIQSPYRVYTMFTESTQNPHKVYTESIQSLHRVYTRSTESIQSLYTVYTESMQSLYRVYTESIQSMQNLSFRTSSAYPAHTQTYAHRVYTRSLYRSTESIQSPYKDTEFIHKISEDVSGRLERSFKEALRKLYRCFEKALQRLSCLRRPWGQNLPRGAKSIDFDVGELALESPGVKTYCERYYEKQ